MSKNSKTPSNCIVVSKGGGLKEMHVPVSEMNRAKYAALCKTPPTYESAFKRHTTWNIKKYGLVLELWARANGRAGQENKYEFPPPVDETTLFFGDCVLVSATQSPLTCSVWKKAYAHLFGGFDDLEKLADQDDAEFDELEHVPNKKKTKHGYLKDGFIIDDSPRMKRSTISANLISLKLATGVDAFHHDSMECKDICGDKTIAGLVRRGDGYNRKIKDIECLDDDDEDDEDDVNEDDEDDEDDEDEDEDHDDQDDDEADDDDDNDDDDDADDDDADADADEPKNDHDADDAGNDGDADDVVDKHVASAFASATTTTPASKEITATTFQHTITSSHANKKRSGGRVNSEKKRGVATEVIKCESVRAMNADSVHEKRTKNTNLDSELEEEAYV